MKIQVLSDLHIEYQPFELVKAQDADILVMAGDIGNPHSIEYKALVAKAANLYKRVIIIRGNHEVYGYTCHTISEIINAMLKYYKP